MKSLRSVSIFSLLLVVLSFAGLSKAETQSNYFISEDLYTFMHSGAGKQFRIVGSVNASTPVILLETSDDGSFVKIRDDREREGWVEAASLAQGQTSQQIIEELNQKLVAVSSDINADKNEIAQLSNQIDNLQQQLNQQQQSVLEANKQRDVLQQQLNGYTDEIEMQWFINGALVAGGGLLLGVILSFLPRRKKKQDNWM
ncbi:TIGR04211 family SH3 domain-containing protein [Neiella marina]|uniref:TIGR04211 family SH3 domain-containing protein n=1 Tax=Neiella holothuriorum TaxID=2870530 RepID=A0ABS7ECL4_9GAMM|nr:TIGR04211 family SH3 domain-containing protein [Neiella holothuriorum]MBW8189698.1 TIGR04211 family SH3 domain-containing protein [Neiella holothuriorum]